AIEGNRGLSRQHQQPVAREMFQTGDQRLRVEFLARQRHDAHLGCLPSHHRCQQAVAIPKPLVEAFFRAVGGTCNTRRRQSTVPALHQKAQSLLQNVVLTRRKNLQFVACIGHGTLSSSLYRTVRFSFHKYCSANGQACFHKLRKRTLPISARWSRKKAPSGYWGPESAFRFSRSAEIVRAKGLPAFQSRRRGRGESGNIRLHPMPFARAG